MDKNEILNKVNDISNVFKSLENNINNISRKIDDVNKIYYKLDFNSSIDINDTKSYLKFQIIILQNEKNYYENLKKYIFERFSKDIYFILESIIMVLSSIENLNIKSPEINNLLKNVSKIKNYKNISKKQIDIITINEMINSIINNLNIIEDFIKFFNNYIINTSKRNSLKNYHCNNLKTNLEAKKNHIKLEHQKYVNKINELIQYFSKCTNELNEQLKYQNIQKFFNNI